MEIVAASGSAAKPNRKRSKSSTAITPTPVAPKKRRNSQQSPTPETSPRESRQSASLASQSIESNCELADHAKGTRVNCKSKSFLRVSDISVVQRKNLVTPSPTSTAPDSDPKSHKPEVTELESTSVSSTFKRHIYRLLQMALCFLPQYYYLPAACAISTSAFLTVSGIPTGVLYRYMKDPKRKNGTFFAEESRHFDSTSSYRINEGNMNDEGNVWEAAEFGHREAMAQMAERCYWGIDGVAKDLIKSVEWAAKAATAGDKLGQFRLGYAFQEGEGKLKKNYWLAVEWYKKAASQGDEDAMSNIGNLYYMGGHDLSRNISMAVDWYRRSAEAGDETGQHNLADCYYDGDGVSEDHAEARTWYKKSADQDDVDSMRKLGYMMVKGEGGKMDLSRGFALWEKAAAKGDEVSQSNLELARTAIEGIGLERV